MPDEDTDLNLAGELAEALEGVDADSKESELTEPIESAEPVESIEPAAPEPAQTEDAVAAPSFLEQLRSHGIEAEDEASAIETIARQLQEGQQARQQAEQLGQMAQYGQQYLENAGEFQQYLAAKQQPVQPETPAWQPPEMNNAWLQQVQRNETTGQLEPTNGGTPETAQRVAKWLEWKQEFDANPYQHMEAFVDSRAKQIAQEALSSAVPGIEQKVAAQHFIATNREWLFEQGQYDAQGNPTLTPKGTAFAGFLNEVSNSGMSPQDQQNFALGRLADWEQVSTLKAQLEELKKAPTPAETKEEFLTEAANQGASHSGSTTSPPAMSEKERPPQNENQSLQEMLEADFKKHGIKNEDVAGVV